MQREALRFTPAGLPVLAVGLQHASQRAEAGITRQLEFALDAVALGEAARRLDRVALGSELDLEGFIAPRSRRSTRVVAHIVEFRVRAAPAQEVAARDE